MCTISSDYQVNEQIRDKELRLVDEEGEQLGIVSSKEALDIAYERGVDLVKIAPKAVPPVARLMDYNKFKFDMQKKEREARKKQKVIQVKEVRLSPVIDTHDLEVKARNAIRFLKDEDKVKVSIRFRGRQMSYTQQAKEIMDEFYDLVKDYGVIERKPIMEGRQMIMFLGPQSE